MCEHCEYVVCKECGKTLDEINETTVSEVASNNGNMPDGWYWMNDFHRYGWEAVLLEDGLVYRNGTKKVDRLDEVTIFKMIKLDLPEKA